ncbi:Carboxylesterase [Gaertneriomyces semiglobifer]|nr:Carboxylesterase [Gaertneriomyces semiglobifer]
MISLTALLRVQVLYACILIASTLGAAPGDIAEVDTTIGRIAGRANEHGTFQFVGIRYAEAARWEAPTIAPISATTISATSVGPSCYQVCQTILCPETISEDCLYLNIWTPIEDSANFATPSLPVLIFIHGGSFDTGSASLASYDGADLSRTLGAIVVSFNYRLSVFGYLDLSELDDSQTGPANYGILDQRLALQWVANNIQAFGGDPSRITLLGQSAGAQSAIIHLAHSSTRDIAKRMVLMSPPAVRLSSPTQSQQKASEMALRLGCRTKTCMQAKGARQILNARNGDHEDKISQLVYRTFLPVVDGLDILDNPFELLKEADVLYGTSVMVNISALKFPCSEC